MPHQHQPLIQLNKVVKTYRTEAGNFTALNRIDLQVTAGEFVGIIGKSGSGKSTLINMITGIDRATAGSIHIHGTNITTLPEGDMAVWRGNTMGIVFQFFQLLPTLTVIENIMLPMDFVNRYPAKNRTKKAMELLHLVDLEAQADKYPSQLSGGQQQRIAIARALATDPPIICADEPTGNLDSKTADQIFALFQELVDGGKTIVMVTHDRDIAKKVSRTIMIADGQVIEEYLLHTFSMLTPAQLAWMTSQIKTKDYHPGEFVMEEGQLSQEFYVITRGTVDVVITKAGKTKVIETFSKGQYFGEIELLHKTKNVASVIAGKSGARIGIISKSTFNQMLKKYPSTKSFLGEAAKQHLQENIQTRRRK